MTLENKTFLACYKEGNMKEKNEFLDDELYFLELETLRNGVDFELFERDFDFDRISPCEVMDALGISEVEIDVLLSVLRIGVLYVERSFNSLSDGERQHRIDQYHAIGKKFAPVAFEIYERLRKKLEEPRISTHLATNRFESTRCHPTTISFWADPDAITGLYESLKKDGYYAESTTTSP